MSGLGCRPEATHDLVVVIGTHNRRESLREALESLFSQQAPGVCFEIIVADNGSTDGTPAMVESLVASGHPVSCVIEGRPGVSFARNAGIRATRAPVVAFMDDDQDAAPDWVAKIHRTFQTHPEIDFIGGRVRPRWTSTPPDWITSDIAGAVSLIDHGDAPFLINRRHWCCLPGGNMAARREVLLALGGFADYRRSEDRELTVRLILGGYTGMHVPDLLMYHHVDGGRLTRAHFRGWNAVEGEMRAGYRFLELFERDGTMRPPLASGRQLLGVPLFVYRGLLREVAAWVVRAVRFRRDAFACELRIRQYWHYIRARVTA